MIPGHGLPRLCFIGPMLGQNPGWVTTQGEILAGLMAQEGYKVLGVSKRPERFRRLVDTMTSLIAWRNEYDLAILSLFSGKAFYLGGISAVICKLLRKPFIIWLHGGNLPNYYQRNRKFVETLLASAEIIVAPSRYLAQIARSHIDKLKIIPNVINIENYPFRLRRELRPHLLWMRTFHPHYCPEMAIEVIGQLRKSMPEIRLTMAGQDAGNLEYIQALVKKNGLGGCVRFAGFLNLSAKQREFSEHDIFINTNRIDNAPVSVIEAAAFGLPLVATQAGGISDFLEHRKTALLVETGDVNGMCQAVTCLLENPELASILSFQGRRLAETWDWKNVRQMWIGCINEVNWSTNRANYFAIRK